MCSNVLYLYVYLYIFILKHIVDIAHFYADIF